MRIEFDDQIFSRQAYGGISKYFADLAAGLADAGDPPRLLIRCHMNRHLRPGLARGAPRLPAFKGAGRVCTAINRRFAPRARGDVLHTTYYAPDRLPSPGAPPMVTTIHDMVPELFPQLFTGTPHPGKIAYVDAATRVICISEQTRRDLERLHPAATGKTAVVHHGIDLAEAERLAPVAIPEAPFILFVGRREGYKNFAVFVSGVRAALGALPDMRVVFFGGGAFLPHEQALIGPDLAPRCTQVGGTDAQARWLMRRAAMFVYPSFYEGFGLPILDAMAQRCPMILADASCFPEIAGDTARYFAADDPDALAAAIAALAGDAALRARLVTAGALRVQDFTMARTVARTDAVYRDCL